MSWLWTLIVDSPLATANWNDWVDILLLAVVIYRGLMVMRGTRAMQSLLGLGVLGVVYVVSEFTGLSTTHWVLDNLFVYVVLALLILFQEDIRRALARAGTTFAPRFGTTASDSRVAKEVIDAVFALAHRRIGALVVVERQGTLLPWCEGAQKLDAHVSAQLLQAVFHPASPLHDGAVVIRKDRVLAAGVFLPISLEENVAKAFGTRHRAAIGISESTDAFGLVVSEERGTVSVAYRGEIVPVADANDLLQRWMEYLVDEAAVGETGEVSDV